MLFRSLERCESVTQRCIIERTVDDLFRKSFMEGLENRFKADDQVGPPGFEFLKRLATMLADVVKIQQYADNEDFKTQACIQVMESLKTNGNIELYLKYVHILSDMHIKFGNHIEAVLCLKLHYDTVTWDVATRGSHDGCQSASTSVLVQDVGAPDASARRWQHHQHRVDRRARRQP